MHHRARPSGCVAAARRCTSWRPPTPATTPQPRTGTAGAGRSAGRRRGPARSSGRRRPCRRRAGAVHGPVHGAHDTASSSVSLGVLADQQQVGVLEGGLDQLGRRGRVADVARRGPMPVRQACWAAGSRSSAIQTRPAAWPTRSVDRRRRTAPGPPSSTTTRSHSAATSSVWWVEITTVADSPARLSTSRSRPAARGRGRPSVRRGPAGPGRPSSAWARTTRRRWPPDSGLTRLVATSARPTQVDHPAYLARAGSSVGPLLEDRHVVDEARRP